MYKVYVIDKPIYSDDEHFFEPSTMCIDSNKPTNGREASNIKICEDVYKDIKGFIVKEDVYYGNVERIEGEKSYVIKFDNYNNLKEKNLDFHYNDENKTITMHKNNIKLTDDTSGELEIGSRVSYTYQHWIKKYDKYIILFLKYENSIADDYQMGNILDFLNRLNDKIEFGGADISQIKNNIINPLMQKAIVNNSVINARTINPMRTSGNNTSPMTIDLPYNARELLLYLQLKKGDKKILNELNPISINMSSNIKKKQLLDNISFTNKDPTILVSYKVDIIEFSEIIEPEPLP